MFEICDNDNKKIIYLPTYRLVSKKPYNREECEIIIKTIMKKTLANFIYNSKLAPTLCKNISEEIKQRVKLLNYERYKIIVIVSIGEKNMQSYQAVVNFLWDAEKDGYATYTCDTTNYFAIATLYAFYYE